MDKENQKSRLAAGKPDYKNCISNLPNSVMRYFGVEPAGEALPILDKHLKPGYRNIVVLLLDGLGVNIVEAHTEPDGFFQSHLAGIYRSTFPPTTVAATTSVLSGPSSMAPLGQAFMQRLLQASSPKQRIFIQLSCLLKAWLSGLWHQGQRRGQPFKNAVVRIPGPSCTEKPWIS